PRMEPDRSDETEAGFDTAEWLSARSIPYPVRLVAKRRTYPPYPGLGFQPKVQRHPAHEIPLVPRWCRTAAPREQSNRIGWGDTNRASSPFRANHPRR